jgi:peptidylprolyl isomerase
MAVARYLAPFAAAMMIVFAVGCGSGKSAAELKAYEAEHPLGPFEGTDGEFTTTDTGLKYRITREGTGAKPAVTGAVEVHYEGKLADGTEFDSSYKRQRPAEFGLQDVVAGWTEGLQLVAKGGQIDLIIPSELGYGPSGGGPIPPDATLYFTVELLDIKQPPQSPETPESADPAGIDPAIPKSTTPPGLGPFADTEADGKFLTTGSGMMYRITRQGKGKKPKATDTVSVHYAGTFADGKEFDSSYKRNEPTEFPLNGVIRGWTEGLQLVGEGGKIQLILPSNLAYGPRGKGSIPANSILYFTVELLKINP